MMSLVIQTISYILGFQYYQNYYKVHYPDKQYIICIIINIFSK